MHPRRILVVGDGTAAHTFEQLVLGLGHHCEVQSVRDAVDFAQTYQPEIIVPELSSVAADAIAWRIRCELRRPIYVAAIADSPDQRAVGVHARMFTPLARDDIRAAIERASSSLPAN